MFTYNFIEPRQLVSAFSIFRHILWYWYTIHLCTINTVLFVPLALGAQYARSKVLCAYLIPTYHKVSEEL